jgi:hypothetical protein
VVLEAQDRAASLTPRIADYGEFHAAGFGEENEAVLFFPYSGEVVIASKDAISAFEASDVDNPEYQELSKILGILSVSTG